MAGEHHQNGRYPYIKIIFSTKLEGRRGDGRPKLRWLDDVEAEIKTESSRQKRMHGNSKGG
jgi:hypothetical protein